MTYTLILFDYLGNTDFFDNHKVLVPSKLVPDFINRCHCYHIGGPPPSEVDDLVLEIQRLIVEEWQEYSIHPKTILRLGDLKIDKIIQTGVLS